MTAKEQGGYLLLKCLREGVIMLACVATKIGWMPVGANAIATYAVRHDKFLSCACVQQVACTIMVPLPAYGLS